MKVLLSLTILMCFLAACNGQPTIAGNAISNFHFQSIFGTNATDSSRMYCLLGNGFIRSPSADKTDSLIAGWIKMHPDAQVIAVTSTEFSMDEKNHKIKQVYCWIIDGIDTLNNFLIRNGCYPGQTMIRPLKWEEMSLAEKEIYDNDKVAYGTTEVFIDDTSFGRFMQQVQVADQYAYDHYLGIWKDEDVRSDRH